MKRFIIFGDVYENFNKTVENTELEIGVDINLTNEKVDADLGVLVCHSGSELDGLQYNERMKNRTARITR